jgi:hypothetical protein
MKTLSLEDVAARTGTTVESLRDQRRKVIALRSKLPVTQEAPPAPKAKTYEYSPTGGPMSLQKQMHDAGID